MKQAIAFLTTNHLILVGFKSEFGYVAISSFENAVCGIWRDNEVIMATNIDYPIFYKCGSQLIKSNTIQSPF